MLIIIIAHRQYFTILFLDIESIVDYGIAYGYDEGIISLSMILHTIPLFVALYYSLKNNKDKNIDYYTLFIPCVSLVLAPFVQVTQILSRFSFYFEIFCIIQYPILLSMSKNNIV